MKTTYAVYIRRHIVFTLLLAMAGLIILVLLPPAYRTPAFPWLVIFFFAVSSSVQFFLMKASEKRFNRFVNYFLISSFLKLLIYIIVLVLYVFLRKEDAVPFAITFFLLYVAFTVFEVISLLGQNKSVP